MIILGINAYHGDSSAAIIKGGKLIAAAEEERFTRIKHWAGFPKQSIHYCLNQSQASLKDIDYIALNRNPKANLCRKIIFTLKNRPSLNHIKTRLSNMRQIAGINNIFNNEFGINIDEIDTRIFNVEHHRAHLASSFFVSKFDEATLVSIDGFGDFTSLMIARGRGKRIEPLYQINYPHSLGVFYSAFTQFLGFPKYGDEYKMMGLAAFGEPKYTDKLHEVVDLRPKGRFELNLECFRHHLECKQMQWYNTSPTFDRLYSDSLCHLFGQPRNKETEINSYYKDIAASVQARYEEAFFHILNHAYELTRCENLCLTGGCALNSLANGKIHNHTPFEEIDIPSAAHDAGGAIGAAYYVYNQVLNLPRNFTMETSCWGPEFSDIEIEKELKANTDDLTGFKIKHVENSEELCKRTAKPISDGKIVGWFQGRMEWGPRALGNRSILADPRREDMRDIINSKIKIRESFRPFAPSILEEYVGEYFENGYPEPFMLKIYPIKEDKRKIIPAVTHVDGTGRLQTVNRQNNPLFWQLIHRFYSLTGVPVLLNTSFNENEPIVCKPKEALDCFLRTEMDVLVLGNFMIERQ
jgi:carbamoyltransferase